MVACNRGVQTRVGAVQILAMKISPALLLLMLIASPHAEARLGETEGQSQLRYGQARDDLAWPTDKPLMPGAVERAYEYQGWRVRAAFAGGACVRIEYVHIVQDVLPEKISDAELAAILDAEKAKFSWREEKATTKPGAAGDIEKAIKGALNVRKWQRADHAIAEIALGLVIKLESRDAKDIERKLAKAAKEKPAPGAKSAPGAVQVPKF